MAQHPKTLKQWSYLVVCVHERVPVKLWAGLSGTFPSKSHSVGIIPASDVTVKLAKTANVHIFKLHVFCLCVSDREFTCMYMYMYMYMYMCVFVVGPLPD